MGLLEWDHERRIGGLQREFDDVVDKDTVRRDYHTARVTCIPIFDSCRMERVSVEYAVRVLETTDSSIDRRIANFASGFMNYMLN